MFKIARTVKQIFNVARNVPKSLLSNINGGLKYCSQNKGYVEDASDEFSFLKVLPSQSINASIQDKFKAFTPNLANIAEAKSTPLLDSAEIRKLIYARFADEIAAKPKNVVDTKSHETKEYVGDVVATYNIADEFKALREQGYNFKELRDSIIDHSSSKGFEESVISDNSSVRDNISKSLSDRMKELVISGHISRYAGESCLKEEVEELMHKKALVIEELMQRFTESMEEGVELIG
jgi:hypothetical protein